MIDLIIIFCMIIILLLMTSALLEGYIFRVVIYAFLEIIGIGLIILIKGI